MAAAATQISHHLPRLCSSFPDHTPPASSFCYCPVLSFNFSWNTDQDPQLATHPSFSHIRSSIEGCCHRRIRVVRNQRFDFLGFRELLFFLRLRRLQLAYGIMLWLLCKIEQDLLWRKEKISLCLPWLSHMMIFLLKIQLEELDRVEVVKKLEVERHLKFFQGNITAAFADLDNEFMEAEKTNEKEEIISQKLYECQKQYNLELFEHINVGRSNHRCQQSTRPCHWYNEFSCC